MPVNLMSSTSLKISHCEPRQIWTGLNLMAAIVVTDLHAGLSALLMGQRYMKNTLLA
jgi:hypothetical protein